LTEKIKMAEKVVRTGIKKEPGFLYFVDKQGDVSRAKMGSEPLSEEERESRLEAQIEKTQKVRDAAEARLKKLQGQ
jgi:hypothetical protein